MIEPPRSWVARVRGATATDLGPLRRNREFRLLYAARGASFFGGLLTDVAVPYQAYRLTHSSLVVGLIGAVELLPIIVFAFLGGAIADWADRRKVVVAVQLMMLATSIALLVNSVLPGPTLAVLLVVTALRGGLGAAQRPSIEAILPRIVAREEMVAAAALNSVELNTMMIAGPGVAGLVLAISGLPQAYLLDILTFALSLGFLLAMKPVPAGAGADRPSLRGIGVGIRYALSRQELIGTYTVDMVAMFFGMPLALFPALADRLGGPGVLGLLYAAPAVGSLIASATAGWAARVERHGLAIVAAASGWGLAIVAFGLAPAIPIALFFLALAGAADTISGIFRTAIWNQTIPDRLRGRLAGIELISYSTGPALSGIESGLVAQFFGSTVSVVSGGVACVAGTVALAAALPSFLGYDYGRWKAARGE